MRAYSPPPISDLLFKYSFSLGEPKSDITSLPWSYGGDDRVPPFRTLGY